MAEKRCAIVTYQLRKSAEEAATALYRKLRIKDCQLKLSWGRPQKDGREVRNAALLPPPPLGCLQCSGPLCCGTVGWPRGSPQMRRLAAHRRNSQLIAPHTQHSVALLSRG